MKSRCSRAAALVVCAVGLGVTAVAQIHVHYTRSELRRLMQEAHNASQYRTLSMWFRDEEAIFRDKAAAASKEYERLKVLPGLGKNPTPADRAKERRDYYSYKAGKMATSAAYCEAELSKLDPSSRVSPIVSGLAPLSPNERMLLERIEELERQVSRTPAK